MEISKAHGPQKSRTAILASGGGSNFQAIVEACHSNRIQADPVLLITNNAKAGVIERARKLDVEVAVLVPEDFDSFEGWDQAMAQILLDKQVDLLVLAGFLRKIGHKTLQAFEGKILNTHPSLLPKFGGQGMYGLRVHQAVIASGEQVTGVSVHVVTEDYDDGPVIAQLQIPVLPTDTAETLEARVKQQETPFFVKVLEKVLSGQISLSQAH